MLKRGDQLASLSPTSPTSYANQDQATRWIAVTLLKVADLLAGDLDAARKTRWLAVTRTRVTEIDNNLAGDNGRLDQYPFDSHGNTLISTRRSSRRWRWATSRRNRPGSTSRSAPGLAAPVHGARLCLMGRSRPVADQASGVPRARHSQRRQRIPDQKRVIEESGAGLCVPMKPVRFAAAVLQLLNDELLAAEFALRGPPYVKSRRSYDILGNNVAKIYNKVLMESL